jgi:sugar phosphate isomerase/epimerase
MRTRDVFVSTGAFLSRDLPDVLEAASSLGLRHIELGSSLSPRGDMLDVVRAHRKDFEFLVHNYFPPPDVPFVLNLASQDEDVLSRSRALCLAGLRLTAELEAPFYAAHAGFNAQPRVSDLGRPFSGGSPDDRLRAEAIFHDSVSLLVSEAHRLGVKFLIENNVVAPFNAMEGKNPWILLAHPDELLSFAANFSKTSFGYLLDVGHLKVGARTLGFDASRAMDLLAPWIECFHLSDNDGEADSNQPFDDAAWFLPWLKRCPEAKIVIEAYRMQPEPLLSCVTIASRAGEAAR